MLIWIQLFFNNIYINNKNFFDSLNKLLIIFIWTLLLYKGSITEERLFTFSFILLMILIYRSLLLSLELNIKKFIFNINNIYIKNKFFRLKNLIIFLLIINTLKNPLLFIIYYMELLVYKICKWVNYNFFYYSWLRNLVIIFLVYIVINPIKFLLEYYYKILKRFKSYTLNELLFKRIEGLVFSILIFSNIINYVKYMIQDHFFIYIIVIIIIISNILKYYNLIDIHYSTKIITEYRSNYTFLGFLVKNLIDKIRKENFKEQKLLLELDKIFEYYFIFAYINYYGIYRSINDAKISKFRYINEIYNEIQNKPTGFIFLQLSSLFDLASDYFLIWKGLSLNKDKIDKQDWFIVDDLNEIDQLRIKISLFLIWYLEEYYNYSTFKDIKLTESHQDYGGQLYYDFDLLTKAEKKDNKKKESILSLFDYDNNKNFWNRVFSLNDTDNDSHNYNKLKRAGLYLWEWQIDEDNKLREERIEWFYLFINNLRIEWLNIKEKNEKEFLLYITNLLNSVEMILKKELDSS